MTYPASLSLVLLTFNRWDRTRQLLDSLAADPESCTTTELVWVDNGSSDGTRDHLREWLTAHAGLFATVRARANDVNHGFIVGVNEGVSLSTGAYVCLINSDTTVPPGWRRDLLAAFTDGSVGAAGPVSNGMPWDQSERHHGTGIRAVGVLYGFCIVIRRDVLDRVGLLDERYGRGVIEVEDWCERARRAGWELRVNGDVLVTHDEPHASYTPRVNAMLHIRNRGLFERKWGRGPFHWGDREGDLVSFEETSVHVDSPIEAVGELLDAAGAGREVLVVAPHRDAGHLGWIRAARADERLNVVCVPAGWNPDEGRLAGIVLANARGQRVLLPVAP